MRLVSSLLLFVAVAQFSPLPAQAPESPSGEVTGHVYCADTHTPCRFASVTLETVPPAKANTPGIAAAPSHSYAATTDLEGSFEIGGIVPGDYYILGRLSGYLSPYDLAISEFQDDPTLKLKAIDLSLTRITVAAGLTTTSQLSLSPGATLAGTIRYDDGGLAINVPVYILRRDGTGKWQHFINRSGDSPLESVGLHPSTNNRGRFYEPGLPPGAYLIEATLPDITHSLSGITGNPSLNIKITTGDALRVFNGDKYRLREATPIELRDGEERSGIDIDIPTSGLYSIHGVLSAKSDGRHIMKGAVRLVDPDDKTTLRETTVQPDGTYTFSYVVEGSYLLQIDSKAENLEGKTGAAYEPVSQMLLVEHDLPDLNYELSLAKR